MRSYNNLYEPMLQDDYIKQCFINASKKKKNRNDVREVLENLNEHTELLKKRSCSFRTITNRASSTRAAARKHAVY